MDVKLKVLEGKNTGQTVAVSGKKFFIGRAEDCHLRPGSDLISRHHCVLLVEDGYLAVRDFGSKNGTFVNEERVVGERELKAGDRLTIGPLHFEIDIAHGLAAKKRPPVVDIKEAATRTASDAKRDPLDVTQWLGDEEEAAAPTQPLSKPVAQPVAKSPAPQPVAVKQDTAKHEPIKNADTQVLSMSETDSIKLAKAQTYTPDPVPEEEAKPPAGKRPPGKLPPIPQSTKDSQSAATAALNKFRKRH